MREEKTKKTFWSNVLKLLLIGSMLVMCLFMLLVSADKYWYEVFPKSFAIDTLSLHCVQYANENGGWVVNTSTGKTTLRGFARVSEDSIGVFHDKGKFGFFNRYTGKQVLDSVYDYASLFSDGLAEVNKDGRIGFIDKQGNMRIPFKFVINNYMRKKAGWRSDVFRFIRGKCVMMDENGKFGLIDKDGTWILKPEYEWLGEEEYGFREVVVNGKHGAISDSTGRMIIPAIYDAIELRKEYLIVQEYFEYRKAVSYTGAVLKENVYEAVDTLKVSPGYWVYHTGMWTGVGLMREDGKQITPPAYWAIREFGSGLFLCTLPNEHCIVLDENGNKVD